MSIITSNNKFTTSERRASFSLASLFAFRLLGVFIILPVFSPYASQLSGATPLLIGLAIGIYGLTQALLQIPFGLLSDHYNRKHIICIGLILFTVGGVVAAFAHSITGIIIGRALQGGCAIGSATIALAADLTRESQRTKAMAIIGITIGISFYLGMLAGPILIPWLNVRGIFLLTSAFGLLGIFILYRWVPTADPQHHTTTLAPGNTSFIQLLTRPELVRLNLGVFTLHALLAATFLVIPFTLQHDSGLTQSQQSFFYLPTLLVACAIAIGGIFLSQKKQWMKCLFLGAVSALVFSYFMLYFFHTHLWSLWLSLTLFFSAFTLLEALLPALASQAAPANRKGAAMGIFSSLQFLGIFVGGTLGGWLYGAYQISGVFLAAALLSGVWLFIASSMRLTALSVKNNAF